MTVIAAAVRPGLHRRRLFLLVSAGAGAVLSVLIVALAGGLLPLEQARTTVGFAAVFLLVAGTGWVIERRVPGNLVGRWLSLSGLLLLLSATAEVYARHGVLTPGDPLPGASAAALVGSASFGLATLAFLGTLATFPDGHPAGPRSAAVLRAGAVVYVVCGLASLLGTGPVEGLLTGEAAPSNPAALPFWEPVWEVAGLISAAVAAPALALSALVSLVLRYRRASGEERLQLAWVLLATGFALVAVPLDPVLGADGILFFAGLLALPAAIGVAMVRWRLYSVDRVVNRTLLFAGISALVALAFVIGVSVADVVLRDRAPVAVSALAAGAVALCLLPVYVRLQRLINRVTFGTPEDPRLVLRSLGQLLERQRTGDGLVPEVADRLAHGLRLSFLAIELAAAGADVREAEWGVEPTGTSSLPLVHNGIRVGSLLAADTHAPGLRADTRSTLEALAPQLAAVLAAVALERELNRSRDLLLVERERERRRIHRDLHDGLGPMLASIGIQAELARRLSSPGGEPARLLIALKEQSAQGVAEVRRIVRGMMPAPLEQLGLDGALVEQARVLSGPATALEVRVPLPLPPLHPQVQVAAYRIAAEAMANAVSHARGTQVITTLTTHQGRLVVEVTDDGRGISGAPTPGVGLTSMGDRAAEVGGSCAIGPAAEGSGTRVCARLPLETP